MPNAYDASGAAKPEGPRALASVPENRMSAEAITAPYQMVARAVGHLGNVVDEATVDWHRQAAEERVVTRDQDGNVQLELRPFEFSAGDRAYNAVARQRALSAGMTDVDRARADTIAKHQNDPAGFDVEWTAFTKRLAVTGDKVLRGPLSDYANRTGGEARNKLQITRAHNDTEAGKAGMLARAQVAGNDMLTLAREGGTETPAYQQAVKNLQDVFEQLRAIPAYNVSQEEVDINLKRWRDLGLGMAASGGVTKAWKENGVVGARKYIEENITNNTSLHLSDADRAHIATFANAKLAQLQGERQIEVERLKPTVDAFWTHLWGKGKPVPDGQYQEALKRVQAVGDDGLLSRLMTGRALEATFMASRSAPDAAFPGAPAPSGPTLIPGASPTLGAGFARSAGGEAIGASLLRKFEGFHASPYWDVNAYRSGYGSDTITRADGSVVRVAPGMQVSREDAERDLARRINTEFLPKAAQTVGGAWDGLPQAAKEALVSVTYNYGSLPGSVAEAARTGDVNAIAGAIRGLAGHNGGVNANRRNQEAAHAAGGSSGGVPQVPTMPWTAEQLKANPHLLPDWLAAAAGASDRQVRWATMQADGVIAALKHDQRPNEESTAAVLQIARTNPPEAGLAEKIKQISTLAAGSEIARAAGNMTDAAGASFLSRVHQLAQGASLYHQAIERDAQEAAKRRRTRLTNDPVAEGADRGWHPPVPPIDFSAPPDRIAQVIAAHGDAARDRGAARGNPLEPALGPPEVAQVKAIASQGTVDQRLLLLSSIAQMPEGVRNATLQQIGMGGEAAVFAFAGGLAQEAPDIARSLVVGHAAMTAKEGYIPKTGANATVYRSSKDAALPVAAFPPAIRADGSGPLAAMSQAIDARYAYLAAQAGDTTGKPNETRLRQATNDVTGGVLWHNGAPVIAPVRGMDQRGFDSIMAGITDGDLAGVTTGSGRPITANYLRSSARLQAVGEAQYLVVLNRNDAAPQYATAFGKAFVLNLKGREPAPPPFFARTDPGMVLP
ncbi:hypothetical protein [Enterovirga sp.]|uniref:glycoside hydrolase family protein n=1 Tax=Enterovirga sp. TaxID=2026350 RepID=UPI002D1CEE78|nr:hypothetical protein [Enterovirga sp.]HMO30406.1 hypothetical protein [Enterovirga sp.]